MNTDMAGSTVAEARIGHVMRSRLLGDAIRLATETSGSVMAFQADREDDRALEKAGVGRAMWRVAGLAPIDAKGSVFVEEWPALVGVTFQASLFVLERGVDHMGPASHLPGGSVDTMRIVTVGADHKALVDAVFEGLRELSANVIMAAVANVHLPLGEQTPRRVGLVNRMARRTNNVGLCMTATADIGAVGIFRMAS
jgi:hypothetical protein